MRLSLRRLVPALLQPRSTLLHPTPTCTCRENVGFPGSPLRLYWRGKQGRMEMSS